MGSADCIQLGFLFWARCVAQDALSQHDYTLFHNVALAYVGRLRDAPKGYESKTHRAWSGKRLDHATDGGNEAR